jgi:hypothetical protein
MKRVVVSIKVDPKIKRDYFKEIKTNRGTTITYDLQTHMLNTIRAGRKTTNKTRRKD